MMAVGLINSVIRMFADPYIKHKLYVMTCLRNHTKEERKRIPFNNLETQGDDTFI
jgi:hypothetical protein